MSYTIITGAHLLPYVRFYDEIDYAGDEVTIHYPTRNRE
jgi:hypothetical protein